MTEQVKKKFDSIEDAIIDLYLNVKIRKDEEVFDIYLNFAQIDKFNEEQYEAEKAQLKSVSPFAVLEYIKSTIEILMNIKLDETGTLKSAHSELTHTLKSQDLEKTQSIETLLQKTEGEVRHHIGVFKIFPLKLKQIEQQLKIYIDSMQAKLEDSEKEIKEMKTKYNVYNKCILQKELADFKVKLKDLKQKHDEYKIAAEKKSKENAELEENLKNSEEKYKVLETKYTISSLSNEIICKNNKLLSKETKTTFLCPKKNSRNNLKNAAVSLNKPESSTKSVLDIYKSRIVPFCEKQNEIK